MQYVNGTAAAEAPPSATALTTANATEHGNTGLALLNSADSAVARFMPVMAIEQAIARREAIVQATQKLMRTGVDFGKVPGTDRDALLQPGADKLCNLFGLVIQYETTKSIEDWTGETHGGQPFFFYEVKGRAYRGDFLMGEGVGSCSSWESKYRWRKSERVCPQCGKANIRKSRDGGWFCWKKTDGCGANFPEKDPAIVNQETGRKPNPDMSDVVNTVLKMAHKRCKVSTTINATSASEFFTQDVEDQADIPEEDPRGSRDDDPRGQQVDTGGAPYGTREAQQNVAERRIAELRAQAPARQRWTNRVERLQMFADLRERVGETAFFAELGRCGVQKPEEFRNDSLAWGCYNRMADLVTKEAA